MVLLPDPISFRFQQFDVFTRSTAYITVKCQVDTRQETKTLTCV
ncbi:hypothetical protein F441_17264, partial [Phytophthora nicotianae CJ01A1]